MKLGAEVPGEGRHDGIWEQPQTGQHPADDPGREHPGAVDAEGDRIAGRVPGGGIDGGDRGQRPGCSDEPKVGALPRYKLG